METYKTIEKEANAEFKDRGSRFIAFAISINTVTEFKEKLAAIKKEHLKASHHCFAYRLGQDGNNFRVSDDGEPSGSAGRPILGQIDSKKLTNILVIVVRYFGGTLLGVPGLVNAYKTVAGEAIFNAGIVEKQVLVNYRVKFDYTQLNDVMKLIKQYDLEIIEQDLALFCKMHLAVPKNKEQLFLKRLSDLTGIDYSVITEAG